MGPTFIILNDRIVIRKLQKVLDIYLKLRLKLCQHFSPERRQHRHTRRAICLSKEPAAEINVPDGA